MRAHHPLFVSQLVASGGAQHPEPASGPGSPSRDRKRTARLIWGLLCPYRGQLLALLVALLAMVSLGVLSALMIKPVFDVALKTGDLKLLLIYGSVIFSAPILYNIVGMLQSRLSIAITQGVIHDIRCRTFEHLQKASLTFLINNSSASLQTRVINDIGAIQGVLTNTLSNVILNGISVCAVMVAMFVVSPVLALMSIGLLPLFAFVSLRTGQAKAKLVQERQQAIARCATILQDTISVGGALLMKALGQQSRAREAFRAESDRLHDFEMKLHLAGRWGFIGFGTLFAAVPGLMYMVAGAQMIAGVDLFGSAMTAGTIVALTSLQNRLFAPAVQLLRSQTELRASVALFNRIFDLLESPVDPDDAPDAAALDPATVSGSVEFNNVSFRYPVAPPRAGGPALSGVSFSVRPGGSLAIVGPSGAGKTTLAHLLLRIYGPCSGRITIDGIDINNIRQSSLCRVIGYVSQEIYMQHATIRDNLLYGKPAATDEEIVAATKMALIHEEIISLPEGYNTVVGQQGACLSGGQRQRLGIARVILRNPPILLLDEATSALDTRSDQLVREALGRLMHGRTTIIIAHRLSTVMSASEILVLKKGKIVERGTHASLLTQAGLYAELCAASRTGKALDS